jgi:hypothetical protein
MKRKEGRKIHVADIIYYTRFLVQQVVRRRRFGTMIEDLTDHGT